VIALQEAGTVYGIVKLLEVLREREKKIGTALEWVLHTAFAAPFSAVQFYLLLAINAPRIGYGTRRLHHSVPYPYRCR
jgi:hypothetical protein